VVPVGSGEREAWALDRTAADDGVFCYTFFKAVAHGAPAPAAGW